MFNQAAQGMTDQNMSFLNSGGDLTWYNDGQVTQGAQLATVPPQQSNAGHAKGFGFLNRTDYVLGIARGRNAHQQVARAPQGHYLPGKHIVKSVIVGNAGHCR